MKIPHENEKPQSAAKNCRALPILNSRLAKQMDFIAEIDSMKGIFRQTLLADGTRYENDAEHSWHLAVMAILLSEYAADADVLKSVKMVLIHDLVEIDAGDTYAYDRGPAGDKEEKERRAAKRIFALLPEDQQVEFHSLWSEFNSGETPESVYATSLDRLQPLCNNYLTKGRSWKLHGVKACEVRRRIGILRKSSIKLWELAGLLIDESVRLGYLEADAD